MDIELIVNSAEAEVVRLLREGTERLRAAGHRVSPHVTFERNDATRFARDAVVRGADLVIAAGGDGTVNEVVNGILPAPGEPIPDRVPGLGVVPLGTGNDFAGFLRVPTDVAEALTFAVEGPSVRSDVAVLNGRYFVNVSSGGLGAEATEETSDRAKRLLGSVAYLVTGVKTFASLAPSSGRFSSGGEVLFDGSFLIFAVGNGRRSGGGNRVTPRAELTDGLLDLCIVEEVGRTELLRILNDLRSGEHPGTDHVIYRQVDRLVVEPSGELCVNVDGEPVDAPSFDYSVVPGALRVVGMPEGEGMRGEGEEAGAR